MDCGYKKTEMIKEKDFFFVVAVVTAVVPS